MKKNFSMRILSSFLVVIMICTGLSVLGVSAENVTGKTVEGLEYTICDGEVTITGFDYDMVKASIEIPSNIEGYPVTRLGEYSFHNYQYDTIGLPYTLREIEIDAFLGAYIKSIYIPASVEKIHPRAFWCTNSLTSITVDDFNSVFDSRYGCNVIMETATNTLVRGCVSSTIPPDTEHIGDFAFVGCFFLRNITIPDTVKTIGDNAFMECGVTSMEIPYSVESLGEAAFMYCDDLEFVQIYGNIEKIEDYTFRFCSNLTHIAMPDTINYIGAYAFADSSFYAYIPNNVTYIGDYAYSGCTMLTEIYIPQKITYLGKGAFSRCISLQSADVYGKNYDILSETFMDCTALTKVNICSSATKIGYDAFKGCESLNYIYLPCELTEVQADAFDGCSALNEVTFEGTQSTWDKINFAAGNEALTGASLTCLLNEAVLTGHSLSLGGLIYVNFYLQLDKAMINEYDTKVMLRYGSTEVGIHGYNGIHMSNDYNTQIFSIGIPAKEMTETITCQVVSPNYNYESEVYTYSVSEYSQSVLTDPEQYSEKTVNLVKSMLNYGAATQVYFGRNTDNLANDVQGMSDEDKVVEEKDFSSYSYTLTQGEGGVRYYGSALALESTLSIKHYFVVDESVDTETIVVTVNGKNSSIKKNGNLYELIIPNIYAQNIYDKYDVLVGDVSLSYCAMDYAARAQELDKQELLPVMYALDDYAQSAIEYIE